jgi:pimeloyl-ACP methyl ester carboxylesterase
MEVTNAPATRHRVQTASGRIGYAEQGAGPVALFVHGVLLNGHLWRHQLMDLSDIRHCIAVDLLAHGDTEIASDQDVSVTANAKMLKEFLDALKIDQMDLVGNDSGGGIAQIFAALYPERIRSLTLTDCDTHDNWPPRPSSPSWRWRPPAVYVERLRPCCRTRASIDHRKLWDRRMNTPNR